MKIVFFGSPYFINPLISVLQQNFELVKVINSKSTEDEIASLKDLDIDLIVVAAYGKIIPQEILDLPKHGSINVHPSLLPKYRGACPIQNALLNGETLTGISIIKMDEKMDHGPIIYREEYKIEKEDTLESLSQKMFQRASVVLPEVINDFIFGKITPSSQKDSEATFTFKTSETKSIAFVDLENLPTQSEINNKIRAFYPEPGAWTTWKGKFIKLLPDQIIQMEGKKAVPLKDFLNGYPDFPIKNLL